MTYRSILADGQPWNDVTVKREMSGCCLEGVLAFMFERMDAQRRMQEYELGTPTASERIWISTYIRTASIKLIHFLSGPIIQL